MAKGWIQINLNCGAFDEGDQTLNVTKVMEIFWKILADTKEHSYMGRIPDDAPFKHADYPTCLLYTSPSPRDRTRSRMPSSA